MKNAILTIVLSGMALFL